MGDAGVTRRSRAANRSTRMKRQRMWTTGVALATALIAGLLAVAPPSEAGEITRVCSGAPSTVFIGSTSSEPSSPDVVMWVPAGADITVQRTAVVGSGQQMNFYVDGPDGQRFWTPPPGVNVTLGPQSFHNSGSSRDINFTVWEFNGGGVVATLTFTSNIAGDSNTCVAAVEQWGGGNSAEPGICVCSGADPVTTATGNYWETHTDLAVPGRGPALDLSRTYNSAAATQDGPFGFGSTFTYGMGLSQVGSTVTIAQENGSQVAFTQNGSIYTPPARVQASLTHNGDGTWTYLRTNRDTFVFDALGRLTTLRDLNGYATTLAYDGSGHLSTVTDPAARALTFTWTGSHITSVADPATPTAHTVGYAYDGNGDLTDVTDVAGGNTHYTYASHRRLTVRDPRQAGVQNPPLLTNVYDAQGRVTQQTDRTGATQYFDFTTVPGATRFTDARGHVTLAYFTANLLTKRIAGAESAAPVTTVFEHDPATLSVTKTTTTKATDPVAHVMTYAYDSAGNLNSVSDGVHPAATSVFNALRLPTSITDGAGTTTTMVWDAAGNL